MGPLPADMRAAVGNLLQRPVLAHLATLRPDGSPHVTPLCIGFEDDAFVMAVTGPQKLRNLERDPRVAFSVTHDQRPGEWLAVEGNAELLYEGDRLHDVRERILARYYGAETARARRDVPFGPGVRALVRITPSRIVLDQAGM